MSQVTTNYSTQSGEFVNPQATAGAANMGFWESLSVAKKILFDKVSRTPKGKLPEVRPELSDFLALSENLKFIWFGHSTLLLNLDGKTILIDPVFSNTASPFDFLVKRFQPPILKLEELPQIDVILISHDHYDHLDKKTVQFFSKKSASFIIPLGVGKHLRDWGISDARITELNWGESSNHNNIKFTATPAQHFSGRGLFDRNKTLWASWVVEGQNEKLYFSGDSGYGNHFKEIGKRYGPFDIAFIENGQYNERWPGVHMQPEETLQAQIDVDAKFLVPIHWGMFDLSLHHWAEPIERTYKIAKAWDIPIYTPTIGEIVSTGLVVKNTPWWESMTQLSQTMDNNEPRLKLVPEIAK